jgi:hypothetical protein
LPTWCNPEWRDDDIFKLSKTELDKVKLRVAVACGARYRSNVGGKFGLEVGGVQPLDPEVPQHCNVRC